MPLAPDREANDEPAYLLGRLWANLHELETRATNNTMGVIGHDKWASTIANPALALRHYGTYAKTWEEKVQRRDNRRTRSTRVITDRMAALIARIGTPQRLIGGEASSWFILGYHHQREADRRDGIKSEPNLAAV